MELSREFLINAVSNEMWNLTNDVLYRLCREHPSHHNDPEIAAKILLIGRSYAASIERRHTNEDDPVGDDYFNDRVIPKIRESKIDEWFKEISDQIPSTVVVPI